MEHQDAKVVCTNHDNLRIDLFGMRIEIVTGSLSIGPVLNACIWPCFGYAFDLVGIPRNALQSIPAFALRTAYALHPSVSLGIRPALYRQICIWNAFGTSELSPTDLT